MELLRCEAEEQYRIFNQKFVVTNKNPMLGVKVPKMRAIAKEIARRDWRDFLKKYGFCVGESSLCGYNFLCEEKFMRANICGRKPDGELRDELGISLETAGKIEEKCSGAYFEEIMIIGMVINLAAMGQQERLALVDQFVPLIDNWAVCDVFCGGAKWVGEPGRGPKASQRVPREVVWKWLQGYLFGDAGKEMSGRELSGRKEFETRFAVVMLMCYFLDEEYLPQVFQALEKVHYGAYYVDMGVAWCLATARAKFDLPVQEFVLAAGLPAGVVKKYEQKVRDSLRVKKQLSSR